VDAEDGAAAAPRLTGGAFWTVFGLPRLRIASMIQKNLRWDETFVVRIWSEGEAATWRASVTNVANGERRYFTAYDELTDALERWRSM